MKKAAALLALHMIWMLPLHPQVVPEPFSYSKTDKELATEYLQKNKHQRRNGILLLIAGVGLASFGASSGELDASGTGSLLYLGTIGALSSVPLLISAAKNKERGDLLLRMQSMPLASTKNKRVPVIGVSVRLGK